VNRCTHLCLALFLLVCLLTVSVAAFGQEVQEQPPADPIPGRAFLDFFDDSLQTTAQIAATNDPLLWGTLPTRLPRGTAMFQAIYRHRRIDSYYQEDGDIEDKWLQVEYPDPYKEGERLFKMDAEFQGKIQNLDLLFAYGLSENWMLYTIFPLQREETWLHVTFRPGTISALGVRTADDFYRLMEKLGQPRPVTRWRSKAWQLGDMSGGVSWQYFHHRLARLSLTGEAIFPTGRLADANRALIYGLGPQIDSGGGSFALAINHRMEASMPGHEWLNLHLDGRYRYGFSGKRRVPRFLPPTADTMQEWEQFGLDEAFFPGEFDDDFYTVTPGSQVEALGGVGFVFHYFAVGLGYRLSWKQEPELEAERTMLDLLNATNAYQAEIAHGLSLEVGAPLYDVYVPGVLSLGYVHPTGGKNAFVAEDHFTLQLQMLAPF